MSVIDVTQQIWAFNRDRTLATLDEISKMPDPNAVLGWRIAPGRAHIAWQLMHIGITEELFATERVRGTTPAYAQLIPRYKGGSTPDDDIPSVDTVRDILKNTRSHLLETASTLKDSDLSTIPPAFKERGWSMEVVLRIIAWHEAHHQGQAHFTLNSYKAAHK